jgi:hypothetical protein
MRIASWKYRLNLPGFELPQCLQVSQHEYDNHSARVLDNVADLIQDRPQHAARVSEDSHKLLEQMLEECWTEEAQRLPMKRVDLFATLLRGIDGLTNSLAEEIATEFDSTTI